jgi:dimethylaniline monooxygenase (N-oxide forming)
MSPKIAVIGAGPLGLMALKNLKDDGFDTTTFEARSYVGGLWQYSNDASISVAESTIFNSSRYRSAISDYPFPDDADDFPTWQQLNKYLEGYVDQFNLRPHIKLNCPVTGLTREDGKWAIEIAPKDMAGQKTTVYFDKVLIAIGSFVKPKQPEFEGIEKFEGRTLHAINYHRAADFKDQNVLLVGLYASAQDVATCLQQDQAKKLYLSHRNGVVLVIMPPIEPL